MLKGKVLKRQTREYVLRLHEYFEKESPNGGPLIPVTQARDRVAATLGISAPTLAKITKEGFGSSGMEQNKLSTPKKKRQPCKANKKYEIINWFLDNGEEVDESLLKVELLKILKTKKQPKQCLIDEMAAEHGHTVLRIPPYHC
ncbi:hypothetical protein EVAR_12479_1 [Eumeta japonica]|uniref:Uncharacterized protein n=1 Tax=Eumeta variegata TaxID=151549 RepID=A0A4C1TPJ0_EUMVA|nr:hypothetical protein EVAR_12479_1 [Eumeta japonica]